MSRYKIQQLELGIGEAWDQVFDGTQGKFVSDSDNQPKHSPIRRKSKLRQTDRILPKPRKSHERVRYRIKDQLQDEYILDNWKEDSMIPFS